MINLIMLLPLSISKMILGRKMKDIEKKFSSFIETLDESKKSSYKIASRNLNLRSTYLVEDTLKYIKTDNFKIK